MDRICPLHKLSYAQQVESKKSHIQKIIDSLNKSLAENVLQEPLTLSAFIEADVVKHYRNKEEFTFGYDHKGQLNCGFTKGDFQKRVVLVDEPDASLIASEISLQLSKLL